MIETQRILYAVIQYHCANVPHVPLNIGLIVCHEEEPHWIGDMVLNLFPAPSVSRLSDAAEQELYAWLDRFYDALVKYGDASSALEVAIENQALGVRAEIFTEPVTRIEDDISRLLRGRFDTPDAWRGISRGRDIFKIF